MLCEHCKLGDRAWCVFCGKNYLTRPIPGEGGKTTEDFSHEVDILLGTATKLKCSQIITRLREVTGQEYECIDGYPQLKAESCDTATVMA